MLRPELLKSLVCPENRSALTVAAPELIAHLNRAIQAGQLSNRAGQKLERPLDSGLVRADKAMLYPVVDEIPMLLIDEAIPLNQPALGS